MILLHLRQSISIFAFFLRNFRGGKVLGLVTSHPFCKIKFRLFKYLGLSYTFLDAITSWPQLLVDSLILGILDGYMKVNEEGKYYCTLCNKVGSRKDSTRRHVKMVHFPDAIAIKAVLDG